MVEKYSVLKIEQPFKKYVIQFQSHLQAKSGKYISQGRAAGIACMALMTISELTKELHKQGLHEKAQDFENLEETLVVRVAKEFAEGDLEKYDLENFLIS